MFKSLIAGVTALSLTLATAMPAQASGLDRQDAGKLLIGLAAIAALSVAIENNNRRDRDRATPAHEPVQRGINRNNDWAGLNRQHRNNNNHRALPRECLRSVETRFGTQRMFGKRCLERNYRHVNSLPGRCAVRVYTDNGPRRGFDPHCLREQGFRSDRRR
jgi:hypothetical protein